MIDLRDDIILATNVRKNAYIKDDLYTVGAVLMSKNGKRYTGCNIQIKEKQTICAETVAFYKAISEGEKEFERLVVIGGPKDKAPEKYLPCEYCREFINEFVNKDFKIYTVFENKIQEYKISELLK